MAWSPCCCSCDVGWQLQSDLISSLGTSICCRYGPKKGIKTKNKQTKKTKNRLLIRYCRLLLYVHMTYKQSIVLIIEKQKYLLKHSLSGPLPSCVHPSYLHWSIRTLGAVLLRVQESTCKVVQNLLRGISFSNRFLKVFSKSLRTKSCHFEI